MDFLNVNVYKVRFLIGDSKLIATNIKTMNNACLLYSHVFASIPNKVTDQNQSKRNVTDFRLSTAKQ